LPKTGDPAFWFFGAGKLPAKEEKPAANNVPKKSSAEPGEPGIDHIPPPGP
jgi:hypothetical protein